MIVSDFEKIPVPHMSCIMITGIATYIFYVSSRLAMFS